MLHSDLDAMDDVSLFILILITYKDLDSLSLSMITQ